MDEIVRWLSWIRPDGNTQLLSVSARRTRSIDEGQSRHVRCHSTILSGNKLLLKSRCPHAAALLAKSELILVLFTGSTFKLGVHTSTLRIGSQRTTEEKNMGFGPAGKTSILETTQMQPASRAARANVPMNGVVLPAAALLHSNASPFRFRQETALWQRLGQFLRENHMTDGRNEQVGEAR